MGGFETTQIILCVLDAYRCRRPNVGYSSTRWVFVVLCERMKEVLEIILSRCLVKCGKRTSFLDYMRDSFDLLTMSTTALLKGPLHHA